MNPNFTPLYDMLLIKPDPEVQKVGSLFVPQGSLPASHKPGESQDTFVGTVVATGPGDRCQKCLGAGCSRCDGAGRMPMFVKAGDRVVYPRRASMPGGEFSVEIEGEKYVMFHEEQFALAVVD